MIGVLASRFFGSANDRYIKGLQSIVDDVNGLEAETLALSDADLRARTEIFKKRISDGEKLDELLPEAFATVREAAKRTLGQRPFDVQLMGGIVLHRGMIAEMKTGEGKTLVATLPVYLNALTGKGVHVVTVNDYLARRDSEWMGQIYKFLGLSVGCIVHELTDAERRQAYGADVTYGTNNEFGFDYLRDNMKFRLDDMAQRPFNYAIVDEVDSILIDEARTPLIISGPAEDSSELYRGVDKLIPKLAPEDYEKDEKQRAVTLTETGVEKLETLLRESGLMKTGTLYDINNLALVHHSNQALRAHKLFSRDTDYIVRDDKIVIIDEFTGRMMEGRRYSEGLHQALEAKEGVSVQNENQTLASITFQNYFRLYPKLAGMTGTAMTEATEFQDIYKLDVIEIPTNEPCIRKDSDDEVYRTAREKYESILKQVMECQARKQPVLIGTVSIEKSETAQRPLQEKEGSAQRAERPLSRAGSLHHRPGRPAGRRDRRHQHGGPRHRHPAGRQSRHALEAGTAGDQRSGRARTARRRDPRRNPGRARGSGQGRRALRHRQRAPRKPPHRQPAARPLGPPGRSGRLEVLRLARGRSHAHLRLAAHGRHVAEARPPGRRGDHPLLDQPGAGEGAGEGRGAQLRDAQASAALRRRDERPAQGGLSAAPRDHERSGRLGHGRRHAPGSGRIDGRALHPRKSAARRMGHGRVARGGAPGLQPRPAGGILGQGRGMSDSAIRDRILQAVEAKMAQKVANYGPDIMRLAERSLVLQTLDQSWKDHLSTLDHLRQGINLRAYAQRDPLNEYKREAFNLFQAMLVGLREQATSVLAHVELKIERPSDLAPPPPRSMLESRQDPAAAPAANAAPAGPSPWANTPRNAPCPCGSGKKFKHCHGRL